MGLQRVWSWEKVFQVHKEIREIENEIVVRDCLSIRVMIDGDELMREFHHYSLRENFQESFQQILSKNLFISKFYHSFYQNLQTIPFKAFSLCR